MDSGSFVPGAILVVEDDPSVRLLVRMILERKGHEVLEASDAEDALEQCRARRQDLRLVVLDVMLPGTSGQELASRMREDLPGMRTLFISGDARSALVERDLLDAEACFLHKPFTPDSLLTKVESLLESAE